MAPGVPLLPQLTCNVAQAKDVGEYHQQHAPIARAWLNI